MQRTPIRTRSQGPPVSRVTPRNTLTPLDPVPSLSRNRNKHGDPLHQINDSASNGSEPRGCSNQRSPLPRGTAAQNPAPP